MFHDVSPEMAGLVSKWCSTLLYGITLVIYTICMYVLIKRRGSRSLSTTWILIGTSTAQFVLATIHVAVGLRLLIEGFIHTQNVPNGAYWYWINPAVKCQVIAKAVYVTDILVADCILIWRMYMVWEKNIYVCVLPIIMTCCSLVTGYIGVARLAQITGTLQPTSFFEILKWLLSTWGLSIATQVMSTAMIAGKIWWHAKRNPVSRSRYISLIVIFIESGALFTLSTTFMLAFADLEKQAGEILGDIATQVATIAPTLIIIRVELIRSETLGTWRNANLTGKRQTFVNQPMGYGSDHRREEPAVQIMVSTISVSDSENELKLECSV